MKHPEELCAEIVAALTTDGFRFYCGRRPDQNFDADEIVYPCVFLDVPITSNDKITATNLIYTNIPVTLFFAYKMSDIDNKSPDNLATKKKAWDAAREFLLRCRQTEFVWEVISPKRTDIERAFDACLSGCSLEVTLQMIDNSSTCLT